MEDVCANRHKGNQESRDANPCQEAKNRGQEEIFSLIESADFYRSGGLTSKEIGKMLNKPLNAISGRISELKAMRLIEPTGERRDGAAVLRLIRRAA